MLSCFDMTTVITNHPGILVYLVFWLRENYYLLPKIRVYLNIFSVLLIFSLCVLLVMSIERYLGAYYPIFHHTSVTKRRLLTLLGIILFPIAVLYIISRNGLVISISVNLLIVMVLFFPPFKFVNFKLAVIARKERSKRSVSPGKRKWKNLKNISSVLWLVAFNLAEKSTNTVRLSYVWTLTCITMNSTFNSLIFFWKKKVLRERKE